MKKFIFLLIFVTSCSNYQVKADKDLDFVNFDQDYSLSDFKKILDAYNQKKDYPNIDE